MLQIARCDYIKAYVSFLNFTIIADKPNHNIELVSPGHIIGPIHHDSIHLVAVFVDGFHYLILDQFTKNQNDVVNSSLTQERDHIVSSSQLFWLSILLLNYSVLAVLSPLYPVYSMFYHPKLIVPF